MPATSSRRPRATLLAALLVLAGCAPDAPLSPHATPSASISAARKPAAGITVILDLQPDGAQDVPFTTTGRPLEDFTLDDDADPTLPNAITFAKARQGTYTVQAGAVAGVTLLGVVCVSDANGGSATDNNTVDPVTLVATIQLERGEAVTCTFTARRPWQTGDVISYDQDSWGGDTPTATNAAGVLSRGFNSVYSATGEVELGIPGTGGFSMSFSSASEIAIYLPANGASGPLTADLFNPDNTAAGTFGGSVLALQLNVDFADAGLMLGTSGIAFGDLTLCNLSALPLLGSGGIPALPLLDGWTVRQYLVLANSLLGGGTGPYTIGQLYLFTDELGAAFTAGQVSALGAGHLVAGACP